MSYQESCPEVGVAVVAGCGEDVGPPVGGCLRKDGGDECEALPLPNQAAGDAVQKSGSLKNLVGGCAVGGLPARSAAFSTFMLSQMRKKIRH